MSRSASLAAFAVLLSLAFRLPVGAEEIPIQKQGGVWMVEVELNDRVTLPFVVDSGASTVLLSPDVALTLQRSGTVSEADFLPGQSFQLADGSVMESPRFLLRKVALGGVEVSHVEAAVNTNVDGPLLLGQSFFEKVGAWSMDTRRGVMVLELATPTPSPLAPDPFNRSKVSSPAPTHRAETPPPGGTPPSGRRPPRERNSSGAGPVVFVILVLAAAGGAGLMLRGRDSERVSSASEDEDWRAP